MHSIAIFLGFLISTYGLACCAVLVVALWQSRSDGYHDVAPYARWLRPALTVTVFSAPLMLAIGGGAMLRWGFIGQ